MKMLCKCFRAVVTCMLVVCAHHHPLLAASPTTDGDTTGITVSPALRPAGKAETMGYHPGDSVLVIPASVRKLPPFCFAGCDGLTRVEFAAGSQCVSLGEHCFAECADLREIRLPASLTEIGEGCFRECRALESLSLPSGVTALPKEMCLRCVALREVELPRSLRKIGSFALAGCERLRSLTIPRGVTAIGSNAFSRCRSITSAVVPSSVTSLESYAFAGCESLQTLSLPANGSMLGELIVADCPALVEIIELSPVPPAFDCESFLFEPDDREAYARCTLRVARSAESAYRRAHAWSLFTTIESK